MNPSKACPGRDSVPGAPCVHKDGVCIFCQEGLTISGEREECYEEEFIADHVEVIPVTIDHKQQALDHQVDINIEHELERRHFDN